MGHGHNHGKMGWTILLNIAITIAEYVGGIMSGSLALLSDAAHNLSDVLSLILGYIGEKFSSKGATKRHSFGFKRLEIFTALINALALVGIAFYILFEAFHRINGTEDISLGIMLGVGAIGLVGNLASILILRKEQDSTVNMKAAFLHLFYDTLSSIFVMLSAIIIYLTGLFIIDIIVSGIIAVMILYSSLEIFKKAVHIFMQGVPAGIGFDEVHNAITQIGGVRSVHDLHIWSVDSNEVFLSCHACVNEDKDTDAILKDINHMLSEQFHVEHTTIQLEKEDLCNTGAICCR